MFIVWGILILSFIVFIHELGHFVAARICGIEVEKFSIGMGPVLLHKKIGKTDWRISLFLLGGYCGMKGENDYAEYAEYGSDFRIHDKTSFYGVHPLKRAFVAFSGPLFNLLFAIIACSIINMTGYTYTSSGNVIRIAFEDEEFADMHSPAYDAGIRTGDAIISIAGVPVEDFAEISSQIAVHGDEDIVIQVLRGEEAKEFTVHTDLDKSTGIGRIGILVDPSSRKLREAKTYSFFPAIWHGIGDTFSTISMTFKGISLLFKGVDITNAVSGPVRITTFLGETVEEGFSEGFREGLAAVLKFASVINVSLFIMNLLPIPVLDGGLILFALIETITRKRISPKVQNRVQYIGIAFIACLMVFAISGDIKYFWSSR